MSDIGVRELKTKASEIVREVREEGRRYVITHRGHPVAAIVPIEEAQAALERDASRSAWDDLVDLGRQIGENWQSSQSSVEILSNLRR